MTLIMTETATGSGQVAIIEVMLHLRKESHTSCGQLSGDPTTWPPQTGFISSNDILDLTSCPACKQKITVHALFLGKMACGLFPENNPRNWPIGHTWKFWKDLERGECNCITCLKVIACYLRGKEPPAKVSIRWATHLKNEELRSSQKVEVAA